MTRSRYRSTISPGGPSPDDLALLEQDRPVAELADEGQVVGHQHDRLGSIDELADARLAARAERLVAGAQDLVEEEDVGRRRGRDREAQPGSHPRRVRLHRSIDERADLGELDDRRGQLGHLPRVDPEERPHQVDVVATGQLHLEAGPEGQQGGHPAVGDDVALARLEDTGQGQQQGALAGAVGTDDRERLALGQAERQVADRPEVGVGRAVAPEHPRERALERRPPREPQVVADPEVVDLDGRLALDGGDPGHRRRRHQRILANAGSTRLNR